MRYIVVTKVPDPEKGEDGNLALAVPLYMQDGKGGSPKPAIQVLGMAILAMRHPVFHVSEIVIVDEGGREPFGLGRKPSKWFIETESFETIEAAIIRAQEIYNQMEAP